MPHEHAVLQTKSLMISAGHSHADPGAYGNGFTEADIVLDLRDRVANELRDRVVFAKDGDRGENLPLADAIRIAKTRDVAVEFHCNAFEDPRANGVETLSAGKDYPFGAKLTSAIAEVLDTSDRGPKGEGSGQHSRLGFISRGGGVILELFFLTNKRDLTNYLQRKDEVVKRIAQVLIDEVTER